MALLRITGIGASPGIGQGHAYIYHGPAVASRHAADHTSPAVLPVAARPAEIECLHQALATAIEQLAQLSARVNAQIGPAEAAVFEAQALFLQDPAILEPVEAAILTEGQSALTALERVLEAAARDLEASDDPYLSARATDLRDVQRRMARILGAPSPAGLHDLSAGTIVIAHDLTPSDTAGLEPDRVRGIVLAGGTPSAHAAILARGLGLPLVVGAGNAIWRVAPGQSLLLDGADGTVLVEPDAAEREHYQGRLIGLQQARETLNGAAHLPAVTLDGRQVELLANAGSPAEARLARQNGAEGIGLLRTEFVLAALQSLSGLPPDEDQLAEAYGAILQPMGERPVIVRAMDAGGDKPLPFLEFGQEANPFLGWRGIRILLDQPELFARQTRALLRAAAQHGTDVRLMFPMVASLDEFIQARHLVEDVCQAAQIELAHPLQIGVMIEVPGAALIADALAREADFFSLGTNDLVQYTLACDRANPRVSHIYQMAHPAVLRLIDMVVRAAHAAGRTVGVCGEAAGDPAAVPLLVGLGADELSVGPARLPELRRQLCTLNYRQLQSLTAEALTKATVEQVNELLQPYQPNGSAE